MDSELTAVVMAGGGGQTDAERLVADAREAITCETVDKLLNVELIRRIIVATDSSALAERLAGRSVIVDVDRHGEPFHFGRRLTQILTDYQVNRCLYIGGGSGPLLAVEDWATIASALMEAENTVITNNFYSTDFAAWTPASALRAAILLENDNGLAWALRFDAGLSVQTLPRSTATQLDVDTPTDMMTLGLHPDCGAEVRSYLAALRCNSTAVRADPLGAQRTCGLPPAWIRDSVGRVRGNMERVLEVLLDREAEVFVAGRVSSASAAHLQSEALCRKRILAEERGMRASGRQDREEVRSLLGALLEDRGPRGFFDYVSQMSQALVLDSRVVLAHRRSWPSASDRFSSDLLDAQHIRDPGLREFTAAAVEASMPVILGGHSLVSGGLWALVDAAWSGVKGEVSRRSGGPLLI
jgi:CTP:molybdopterin cytidylyltransferase MocA